MLIKLKVKLLLVCLPVLFVNPNAIGQTKKETIDWLNEKFYSAPIITDEIGSETRFTKINEDGSFEVVEYSYAPYIALPNLDNYRFKTSFSGHIKNLSPASIILKRKADYTYFYATCSKGKCITQKNLGKSNFLSFELSDILLAITDSDIEARVKKAIIHLIRLYGGKKEAF